MTRHLWINAPNRASRRATVAAMRLAPLATVDAHRRLRGPYTAGGALLRALVPDILARTPDLAERHDIEILAVATELRALLPGSRWSLTSAAPLTERTRYYPRTYTARLANGITELLLDHFRSAGPATIVVENVHEADATDVELLAVLLRRSDPALLRVIVCSAGELPESLVRHVEPVPAITAIDTPGDGLAARYVAGDCISDDPNELAAYEAAPATERAALHDARADELAATGEFSYTLGAIPFHRERGSDPHGAGSDALFAALTHCGLMGFYDAVLDLGQRSLTLLDWESQVERCWLVVMKLSLAHSVFDQPDHAAGIYDMACAATPDPSVHLQAAYGRAMLYTRFYPPEARNHELAKSWINTAIAIASLAPDRQQRAYNVTFNENGRALIEMHLGNLDTAMRLIDAGVSRMDTELPGEQTLHRSVLLSNRAQLFVRMGQLDNALAAYDAVITVDPNHSEYYFERADVQRKLRRYDEALADYATAMRLSPPYPELYYNRADLARELGQWEQAIADYSYVLDIDPQFLDAYVNRASLHHELGDTDAARRDVTAGLEIDPDNAHLLCLQGKLLAEAGEVAAAREAVTAALRTDDRFAEAWAIRADLAYTEGDLAAAMAYLDRAVECGDTPEIRYNRAVVHEESGHYTKAIADYDAVLAVIDDPDAKQRRDSCRQAAANQALGVR